MTMEMLLLRPRDANRGTAFTQIRTLTLPSVAAELSAVAQVEVVDEGVMAIPGRPYDLVGITCDTTHAPRAYLLADRFRARGIPVLLGGTHPSAMPDEALGHCDSVVIGEVEGLAPAIAADVAKGSLKPRYQLPAPPDISTLPIAPVDLLPQYNQFFKPYPIELTRGCRNACRFCFNRYIHGRGFRRRNLDDLADALAERPETFVLCMDDNLMNDREHLAAFAEKIAPLGKTWGGQSTMDLGDDRALLSHLVKSGFSFTFVGLESFSPRSLAKEAKGFNDVDRYREQFKNLRDLGIFPFAGVILGLDGDGPEVFRQTYRALKEIAPAACAFTFPVPYPGTAFHRQMERQNRIINRDAALYDGHHVVVRPLNMTPTELITGYHRLAAAFYSWNNAFSRLMRHYFKTMNLSPLIGTASYFFINLGYRRFHQRLRETQPPLEAEAIAAGATAEAIAAGATAEAIAAGATAEAIAKTSARPTPSRSGHE